MKKMLVVIGMIAAAGILYACGGSSGGGSSTGGNNNTGGSSVGLTAPAISSTPTPVATKTEVVKTASSSTALASSFVKGGGIPNLGSLVGKLAVSPTPRGHSIVDTILGLRSKMQALQQKQMTPAKQVAATQTFDEPCSGGGSRTISVDPSNAASGFSMSANQCKESGTIENGTVSIAGISSISATDFSGATFTTNLTQIDYDSSYTTKKSESALNLTMKITSMSVTGTSMVLNITGTKNDQNYVNKSSDKSSFSNFTMNISVPTSTTSGQYTITLNGIANMETYSDANFTVSALDTKSGMTLSNLKLVTSFTASGTSMTIDGTYAIATIPACMDGTFVISTQTPITTDSSGKTTGGKMTVNGAVLVFNTDGSVQATTSVGNLTITAAEVASNACKVDFAGASF